MSITKELKIKNKESSTNKIDDTLETRLIKGIDVKGLKLSDLIKKGWKKDSERMTANQIRNETWERNNGR